MNLKVFYKPVIVYCNQVMDVRCAILKWFRGLSTEKKGELFIGVSLLLWGMMPVLVRSSANVLPPLFFAGSSIFIAGIVCLLVLVVSGKTAELICKTAFRDMLFSTLIISVLFYGVLFWAGQKTRAGNIAILNQSEVIWTFLFFTLLGFEKVTTRKIAGTFFVLVGVSLIVLRNFSGAFVSWDLFLVLIFTITPVGNYFQKRALTRVSSITQLCFRSLLGGFFLLSMSVLFEKEQLSHGSPVFIVSLIALNGLLALGVSKILFLESLKRLEVSKTIALGTAAPAVTMIAAYFILDEIPEITQLLGLACVMTGILIMVWNSGAARRNVT
ncbi:MAG: DMT family transporter [Spirochaetes bacterium]|nr:DMT family transporter [Spirochaetota bacterium]